MSFMGTSRMLKKKKRPEPKVLADTVTLTDGQLQLSGRKVTRELTDREKIYQKNMQLAREQHGLK